MRSLAILGCVLLAGVARAVLFPAAPLRAEWTLAGSLERPRSFATAVAVAGGDILVFGGLDENDPEVALSTSELLDPASGKVEVLGGRIPGRLHHTVTVARDGRVVVAGGVEWLAGHFASTDLVSVYVPYARAWTHASPLLQARSDHGAALLQNGEILVTGGNFNARLLATSEIYDPATDRWREAAPLSHPRIRFSIAPLSDGRVIVAGGLDQRGRPLATSEIYDPRSDRWTSGPDLSVPRVEHAMVTLPGGDLLLIGGEGVASSTAERYDHLANAFRYAGALVVPRLVEQAAPLADGRVLITGGSAELPGRTIWVPMSDTEVWDPASNTWSEFPAPAMPRALGTLVPTSAGLYLISGVGDRDAPFRAIERLTFR